MQLKDKPAALDISEHVAALADLSPQELIQAHARARNAKLRAEEDAKGHPISDDFAIPADLFERLCARILDGGGVIDDRDLSQEWLQATANRDQSKFWPLLFHLGKCRAKIHGHMRALPHGGVSLSGVSR